MRNLHAIPRCGGSVAVVERAEDASTLALRLLCSRSMPANLPSLAALQSTNDGRLDAELRLVRLRTQVAVVRTLADRIEELSRAVDAAGPGDQLFEEMVRLGHHLVDVAEALGRGRGVDRSGIFARPTALGRD
jgi:hypothetical protein